MNKTIKSVLKKCILVLIIFYVYTQCRIETFSDPNSDIVFYGRKSCPYCVKMKEFLDSKGFRYKYISTASEPGKSEYRKKGATGVPFFVNTKNGMTSAGYIPNMTKFKGNLGI